MKLAMTNDAVKTPNDEISLRGLEAVTKKAPAVVAEVIAIALVARNQARYRRSLRLRYEYWLKASTKTKTCRTELESLN